MQVIEQRRLLGGLLEVHLATHPIEIFHRPGTHALRGTPPMAQQEFREPMACAQLITLGGQTRTHQIAQRFVCGIGHPHRGQVAHTVTARQVLSIENL